ncbi:phospholipid:diacylglycerol acyltransferase [Ascoidea rubescens DSM 1968]|uniref:Phospholipid:diacylglycerol acyltransferase n=1 Tax=Ascoidea rubescens DSM 1968 TaxID=1344418 RepID=A0A1D2VHX1_9ASCO|nr:phospholipid:diacylglycerol acyltransferase [Ascoidea rubescens DSM 1968]ODV61219.1 phospholipid:diacylglycerol acyltransferase [Ascoidea rubescens DSM 1968]
MLLALYFGAKQSGVELSEIGDKLKDFDIKNFELKNFDSFQNSFLEFFDDLKDNFPTPISSIMQDIQAQPESKKDHAIDATLDFAIGKYMKSLHNLTSRNPVIMVPGVISTGLESWGLEGTPECPSQNHFRKRLWGSFYMLKTMFLDKACWLQHIMLDQQTGLDPPFYKIRAAQGFEATDYFVAGYWIWGKILNNLAAIGYNPNNMINAAYDWRLSYLDLERRDGYFSKLKHQIEYQMKTNGHKSVLIGHSMGSQVIYYFMKWVEASGPHFGNGGSNWCNDHISSYIDISGSVLGTPKAIVALLSGEMKDTVQLNALAVYGLEKFFSRKERLKLLRSFGGIASMIPKGGNTIWGNLYSAPDDEFGNRTSNDDSFGKFIGFQKQVGKFSDKNLTMEESIDLLLDQSPEWFHRRTLEHYSFGIESNKKQLLLNNKDFSKWSNPLEAPLPYAPNMKVYCFYGVGNPTERAYTYKEELLKTLSTLNLTMESNAENAVIFSDGDGTVSILTHTMCHKWKEENSIYNPGNSKVKIVEILHQPDKYDIRGGAKTAEHVDILGSTDLNELILKVVSGRDDLIEENIISKLPEYIKKMNFTV